MFEPKINDGVPEVSPEQVLEISKIQPKTHLIDVRRAEEFTGELGHVKGAKLVTLGPELTNFLRQANKMDQYVFICRSGARSGQATLESLSLGFTAVANMVGGMIKWNEQKLPTHLS